MTGVMWQRRMMVYDGGLCPCLRPSEVGGGGTARSVLGDCVASTDAGGAMSGMVRVVCAHRVCVW